MGPLHGLSVMEMAGIGPGPLAGQLLADLGADVVVVDRKSGNRHEQDVNRRGKRSIALDLKCPEAIDIALRLAGKSDVLIEGFRPGVMERLGLGPEACHAANPALVYGRMTGWGQQGPLRDRAGHDINYLATTGALHAMGDSDRPPPPPLNLVADYGGGAMFLVLGVLAALFDSRNSGKGQVVDAAMVDGVPAMMGLIHSMLAQGAFTAERGANMLDGGAPYYRCYETSDGKFVSVGALEPQFFAELVGKLGLDEKWIKIRNDPRSWPELRGEMAELFASQSRAHWANLFEGSDACVAPVLEWPEVPEYFNNADRGVYFETEGVMQAAPAPRFSRSNPARPEPGHASGADNREVLSELGYGSKEIDALAASGAVA